MLSLSRIKTKGSKCIRSESVCRDCAGKCQAGEVIKGREKHIPNTPVIPRGLEKRVTGGRRTKQGGRCVSVGLKRCLRE